MTKPTAEDGVLHQEPTRQQPSQQQPSKQQPSKQQQPPKQPPPQQLKQQPQVAEERIVMKKGHWAPGAQWQGGDADGVPRKRTKTRSKQKNRRRDNRPEGSWMKNATG